MLYTSEVTGKTYKTVEELEADEKAVADEKTAHEEEVKALKEEVESKFAQLQCSLTDAAELFEDFIETVKKYEEVADDEVGICGDAILEAVLRIIALMK